MKLLRLLADGRVHSGVRLAKELGVSRMTVSNHVAEWVGRGVDIEVIPARGYRLSAAFEPLLQECISRVEGNSPLLLVHDVVTSTNDVVREELLRGTSRVVCFAEYQTAGRGRRGRTWEASPGGALCGSWGWGLNSGVAALQGLSLAVGVVVATVLSKYGVAEIGLKWPNDVVVGLNKLGGILIEVIGESEGPCQLIVGIGVNLSLTEKLMEKIGQPVTDLHALSVVASRNDIARKLYSDISSLLDTFPLTGFSPWKDQWEALDTYVGHEVVVTGGVSPLEGVAAGVSDTGALLINTPQGVVQCYGGELSLRRRD